MRMELQVGWSARKAAISQALRADVMATRKTVLIESSHSDIVAMGSKGVRISARSTN